MEDFCGIMNMPTPITKTTYYGHLIQIHDAYTKAAAISRSILQILKPEDGEVHGVDVSLCS